MKRSTCSRGKRVRIAAGLFVAALTVGAATSYAGAGGGANQIRGIEIRQESGQTVITVKGSSKPTFTAFKLTSPRRLVVDVANSRIKGVPSVTKAETPLVDAVAVSEFSSGGVSVSRVMIGFKSEAAYRVSARGNDLVVSLLGGPAPAAPPAIAENTETPSAQLEAARAETEAAERRVTAAESETKAVNGRLAAMQADVDKARGELDAAKAELAKIAAKGEENAKRAKEAAEEASSARKALFEAKAELARLKDIKEPAPGMDEKKAAKQIIVLREQIARAEEKARAESGKRDFFERRISYLESQIALAKSAAAEAEKARESAVASDSTRELARAEKLIAESKRNEERLAAKLVAVNASRAELEERARIASEQMAAVVAEKERVESELTAAKEASLRAAEEAKRAAKEAVAAAETRIREAETTRSAADKECVVTQKRLASAERNLVKFQLGAVDAETALREARKTIVAQEKRIAALEKAQRDREESAPAKKEGSVETDDTREETAVSRATQEQVRLARSDKMQKGTAGAADTEGRTAPKSGAPKVASIRDIRFVDEGLSQKIVIEGDGALAYETVAGKGRNATLLLRGVALPKVLERTLDAAEYDGPIRAVSSYGEGDAVRVDVELSATTQGTVTKNGSAIEWSFPAARKGEKIARRAPLGNTTKTFNREDDETYSYPQERTAAYSVTLPAAMDKRKRYTGRHIDLDFKDADIHNILRLLSDVGQVNIVTADDVSGAVTIRMRDVPWDQALDVVLQAKHYGMIRDGNLIRVAPLATLEKEREMEIARRKQSKELEPLETRLIPISYAQASEIHPRAADILSERGKMSVDQRTNVIIARDTASNLDQIEALVRNLDTQTPQVLIEGRIVEATSTYAREIGIQWGGDFTASSATGNPTGLGFPSALGIAGGATDSSAPTAGLGTAAGSQPNPNFAVNLPAAAGTGSGGALGITLGSIANNANLNLRLSALEEEGTLRILSSPKILTLDNREAHIEQGTLIPYSRVSAQGIQTAFKEAKLNLTVTPHVTADGSVLLKLSMTRDEPDFNNKGARGDPTILKREAATELLVNDGHTAVIGGIFTRNNGTSFKKVPFFGDIPILGWLFKSKSDSDRRTEMLIFITPRIVNRAESIGN